MPTYSFKVHSCKKVVCAAQKYKAERESVLMLKLTNTWIERNNSFYRWIKLANFLVAYLLLSQKYTHREMVFCYQNCSDLLWSQKFCKFEAEGREFQKFFLITRQFFLTVGQNNFGNKIPFLSFLQRFRSLQNWQLQKLSM